MDLIAAINHWKYASASRTCLAKFAFFATCEVEMSCTSSPTYDPLAIWIGPQDYAQQLDLDLSRRVSFMSTGMRQKLALAATLSADTPLIILDEPTSNLDPTVRGTVMGMVAKARRQGRTVMFSSHVLSEVEETCDRVVILRAGQLVHTQVMSELRRRHRIHATMRGSIPTVPPDLDQQLSISMSDDGHVMIETPGELSPLLGWLSTLDLHEVRIEPVGLRAVYDQFHSELS